MTVHEAPLDHIVQCHLVHRTRFAGNAPPGSLPASAPPVRLVLGRSHAAIGYDNAAVVERFADGHHVGTLTLFDGYTDATPPSKSAGMLIQHG
ncbi:hypothetical protein ACIBG0_07205 [Nocardia sp. NPDC050630]|uniref:hypothetical protein n=1 Tax=Nocardia sp. NPDC050630 TaxID=3364321 RepID=UPI0037BA9B24